jgi:hypothetical protein
MARKSCNIIRLVLVLLVDAMRLFLYYHSSLGEYNTRYLHITMIIWEHYQKCLRGMTIELLKLLRYIGLCYEFLLMEEAGTKRAKVIKKFFVAL